MTSTGAPSSQCDCELVAGIRVFPELRSAHVTDIDRAAPRRLLYFAAKYDLGSMVLPHHISRVSFAQALRAVRAHPGPVLELWEPLWLRMLPQWLALSAAWKLGRRGRLISVFAIENNEADVLFGRAYASGSRMTRRCIRSIFRRCASNRIDRLAFGTPAARAVYEPLIDPRRTATTDHLDLLCPSTQEPEPRAASAAFVGALEPRKGIGEVLRAWPEVERRIPQATITIIGDGPDREVVEEWVRERPESRSCTGAIPRGKVREALSRTSVLVAPSVAEGRWREQVGRPIQEALAAGCTVVTTSDTGLATYLERTGHAVLAGSSNQELVAAVTRMLRQPLDPGSVRSTLPSVDGRMAADAWLHRAPTRTRTRNAH